MTRRPAHLLVAAGLVAFVAGCSGGSDTSSDPAEVTTVAAGTASADGELATDATTDTVASADVDTTTDTTSNTTTNSSTDTTTDGSTDPSVTTDADADPPGEVFTGDRDSLWCGIARELDDADTAFDEVDFTDPAAVEEAVNTMISQLDRADGEAPPEIADDVQVVIDTFRALDVELAAVDYDFLEADLSVLDEAGVDRRAASDRIESYNEQVCGIARTDDADATAGSDFDPSAGTIRDQSISQLVALGFTSDEAACLFDGLDFTDPELATQYDTILAAFDACDIDPARLADLGAG